MFQVCIQEHFDAAHFLRQYRGECANLHGHRWTVTVCVEGSQLDDLGMLMDFSDLKHSLHKRLKLLDHCLLNDLPLFGNMNPTAENLARFIYQELKEDLLLVEKHLAWVQVNESPEAWSIYKED